MNPKPSQKKPWTVAKILGLAIGTPIALYILVAIGALIYVKIRMHTTYYFDLPGPMQKLTDEDALSYARQAMVKTGYDLKNWEWKLPDKEQVNLPDGQELKESPSNPNRTYIQFTNKESQKRRTAFVEATGKTMMVTIQRPKEDLDD